MTDGDDGARPPARLGPAEVQALIVANLPRIDHHGEIVEQVGDDDIRLRLPFDPAFVGDEAWQDGAGQVFSGPMVMGFADTAMYACVLAAMGRDAIPVMVSFTINFLRPAAAADLIAEARIVRRGGRLSYLECWLTSDGQAEPCAHITSTYRVARAR